MKKILEIILIIVISILICLICVSYNAKKIVKETLSKNIVKKEISSIVKDEIKDYFPEISYDDLDKIERNIGNSYYIDEITDKYIEDALLRLEGNVNDNYPDIKDDIKSLIIQNKDVLNDYAIDLSDEDIDNLVTTITKDKDLNEVYVNNIERLEKNLSDENVTLINTYNKFNKPIFRWICAMAILLSCLIIIVIRKNIYSFMLDLFLSFFLSGVILTIFPKNIFDYIEDYAYEKLGYELEIATNYVTNCGYICFAIGALLLLLYIIIKLIINHKRKLEVY